jgi:hypothetical protein
MPRPALGFLANRAVFAQLCPIVRNSTEALGILLAGRRFDRYKVAPHFQVRISISSARQLGAAAPPPRKEPAPPRQLGGQEQTAWQRLEANRSGL